MARKRTRTLLVVVLLAVLWLSVTPPVPPVTHANQTATQPTQRAVLVKGKEMTSAITGSHGPGRSRPT
jgi:hypothetical protein